MENARSGGTGVKLRKKGNRLSKFCGRTVAVLKGVGRCIGSFFLFSRSILRWKCKLETERAIGRKQPARSIYLAEACAPAFAGVQLYLPRRSVIFRKVSRFSLYLLAAAISRADSNSEPDGFAGSACPGALARHSLLREKAASPTDTGARKSVSQPHP